MEKWYNAIEARFSVRRYRSSISAQEIVSLQKFANENLQTHGVRIAIGRNNKVFSGRLFQKKITGTESFAAIISKNGKDLYSGYVGEIFVLECVSRGYGTCWIGSSFKMSAVLDTIELEEGESIVCVTPIGIPDEDQPYRKRVSITELTDLTKADFFDLPKWQQTAIECARTAPSAMNRQPWQFYVYEDSFGIVNISRNLGFGLVDCGIAMLHAELGAAHEGVAVDWDINNGDDEAIMRPIPMEDEDDDQMAEDYPMEYEDEDEYAEDEESYDVDPMEEGYYMDSQDETVDSYD